MCVCVHLWQSSTESEMQEVLSLLQQNIERYHSAVFSTRVMHSLLQNHIEKSNHYCPWMDTVVTDVLNTVPKKPHTITAHTKLTFKAVGGQQSMLCAETRAFTSTGPRDGKALRSHLDGFFPSAIVQVPTSWFLPYASITFIDFFRWSHLHKHLF